MNKLIIAVILSLGMQLNLVAQYKFIPVFTGEKGQALLDDLVKTYKPPVVLDYSTARDTLFFRVFRQNDSLACIYSDHKLPLPNGYDPTTVVYLNGMANGINTEHAYPQSKGAEGGAKSDMHHLYPSKANVNEARSNLPYGESPDNTTQRWFYKEIETTNKPLVNINAYAEVNANVFEPREIVKGDLARSIFYFYTMYRSEADAADPNFFNLQKNTLCQWHLLDPVDSIEWTRNEIIAKYQGGSKNPYILDCTLPYRTFCADYQPACDTTVATNNLNISREINIYPNPFANKLSICAKNNFFGKYEVSIHDMIGRLVFYYTSNIEDNCIHIKDEQLSTLNRGVYILSLKEWNTSGPTLYTKAIIKQ